MGAYKLGARSQWWSLALTPILLRASWLAFDVATTKPGEGAASGVAVVLFIGWIVVILGVVAAVSLLVGSVMQQRSWLAGAVLVLGVLPFGIKLGGRMQQGRSPQSASALANSSNAVSPATPPMSSDIEGYEWAIANGVTNPADCERGSRSFTAGCKRQVAGHSAHD